MYMCIYVIVLVQRIYNDLCAVRLVSSSLAPKMRPLYGPHFLMKTLSPDCRVTNFLVQTVDQITALKLGALSMPLA